MNIPEYQCDSYDVAVIGAGHAGCEAALACARLGLETIVFMVSADTIALMPCNPNIGGTSKGHLVRELDALGGEMGKNIDRTYIQSKMLNRSKGPAVHSLRAQADKQRYTASMRRVMENQEHLTLKQAEVTDLLWRELADGTKEVTGVKIASGGIFPCRAAILCSGVYLNARCIYGEVSQYTGPNGLPRATKLTDSLVAAGLSVLRFKTGTPARIDGRTIDYDAMTVQKGDEPVVPFSFTNRAEDIAREQVDCYLTYTNETTHEIIRENLDRSPLFSGDIKGTGPRYCPSIEDKVVRFPDKERHQVFIEPEGEYTNEMYLSGLSSSLPEEVQIRMYRSIRGLEHAKIVRNAYAIEYDCLDATQLKPTLECKTIHGFFSAGQANGSSGYEEAAAQGLVAGMNAALLLLKRDPVVIDRSQGYIGVLIDDLVTKESREPYRMMTSRAEYRLLLRQDNADLRLTEIGHRVGLISDERYDLFVKKRDAIAEELTRLNGVILGASESVCEYLRKIGSAELHTGTSLAELLRRPEMTYEMLAPLDPERPTLDAAVIEQVEIEIKYEGYIERQRQQVEHFKKLESRRLPADLDYTAIPSLRLEARQKLQKFRPENVGQASRISGVSPADISVLLVWLGNVSRET
ncbi:MAG: tRNA uridine-5-carboxymethylaminomethyl(34) synthesis enzyme MnmG [Lachnospiraceae bacterium]|nr:tRNA uridine-5-carboxymethylaminomethyl(34) synthesis enzyme MnmG [Lachnospiraceae bacterium]MCR5085804.1 tRNA uridine-5-carboxymethylaminomethyl(34) synthesis enzyme MnmG [Lachnospiraceae bacterium]